MIPVENLYYLLLYAWDAMAEGARADVEGLPKTSILDLLAAVLNRGIDRQLRRGLDRGYLPRQEEIPGVRGKLDVTATVKRNLRSRARAACEFDELDFDVPHNRILKATAVRLLGTRGLAKAVREALSATDRRFPAIRTVPLTDSLFRSVQLHRNIGAYRLLMDVCRLIFDCLVPEGPAGRYAFRDFLRDEDRMHRLFERFLRNFYRREQAVWKLGPPVIHWDQTGAGSAELDVLPRMEADIRLNRPGRVLVIDAKFYRDPFQTRHGHRTLRSAHLYQMTAYLRNLRATEPEKAVDGILLYPVGNAGPFDYRFQIHGSGLQACTVNLNQHWTGIRADLLNLVGAK